MKNKSILFLALLTLSACETTPKEETTYRIETSYIQSNGKAKTLAKTCHYNAPCIVELEVLPSATHGEAFVRIESLRLHHKKSNEWAFKTYVRSANKFGKMIETVEEIYTTSDQMSRVPLVVQGKEGSQIQIKVLPNIKDSCKEVYIR